jgi:5-deoxy-5-amino-3-dehydroquinate synthase
MIRVPVALADHSYEVVVGSHVLGELNDLVPDRAQRAAVVTQTGVDLDLPLTIAQEVFLVPRGEAAKQLAIVEDLCRSWARWGLTRHDVVIAVGGGAVTDTGGFAASIYHRGVAVVHVATTLLAQVDAAIGGKTGVNLPEGKNLVGTFWQPSGVICDTSTLDTLPTRELRSGMGEMAKYHFLTDLPTDVSLEEKIAACVRFKGEVVAEDEREGGRRAVLNYGHTLGHALEIAGSFDLRHGEAVAIGLMFAATLACRLGRIPGERVEEHARIVASYDLPTRMPQGVVIDDLLALMARDKKALNGLTFALDGPRGVEVVTDVPIDAVRGALEEFAA